MASITTNQEIKMKECRECHQWKEEKLFVPKRKWCRECYNISRRKDKIIEGIKNLNLSESKVQDSELDQLKSKVQFLDSKIIELINLTYSDGDRIKFLERQVLELSNKRMENMNPYLPSIGPKYNSPVYNQK